MSRHYITENNVDGFFFSELKLVMQMERKRTHNPPEYMAGRGETIDLFILLIRACISCPVKEDRNT